ncbi:MAG: SGNH/GDSL hydrolase family protein, partial [Myxococcota bacterium]|nr:SGNH/GDSL hydrolase family protein [Myxococcota bacterium]
PGSGGEDGSIDASSAAMAEGGGDDASAGLAEGGGAVIDAPRTEGAANPGDASRSAEAAVDAGTFRPCPAGTTPCAIMPLGDSITYGYGQTTGGGYRVELFRRATTDNHSITYVGNVTSGPATVNGVAFPQQNEGHSGYTIDDSASTKGISPLVDASIAANKPNIVLLMIGTNDMHYGIDLANAPARLGRLIDRITTDAPGALLLVGTIIPANGAQNTPTQAYNAAIPGVLAARAAQGKHLAMVDLFAAIGTWSSANYKDSEHPNDSGYALMAQAWYVALKGYLP